MDFRQYVQELVAGLIQSYGGGQGRIEVQVDVDDVVLGLDTAVPCGLIINELVSNALKHAFPGHRGGQRSAVPPRLPNGKVRLLRRRH